MNNAQAKYRKKCKQKLVVFYPNEQHLIDVANSINFQKSVKLMLQYEYDLRHGKAHVTTSDLYEGVERYGNSKS